MGRSRFTMIERSQVARAGTTYSYRTVSCVVGCGKSTVGRYVRAHSEPNLPLPRLGRPPRLTRDDIALTDQASTSHRHLKPINLLPVHKEMGLVISESTLRQIMKKLGFKRYVSQTKPFGDERARVLCMDYANRHLNDGVDAWRRTIFSINLANKWTRENPGHSKARRGKASRMSRAKTVQHAKDCDGLGAIWYGGRSELHRFERTEDSGPRGGVTAVDYSN